MAHSGYDLFSNARTTFYRARNRYDEALSNNDLPSAYTHVLLMEAAAADAWRALAHIPSDDESSLADALEMKGIAFNLADRVSFAR